jgi:hypothetical protein
MARGQARSLTNRLNMDEMRRSDQRRILGSVRHIENVNIMGCMEKIGPQSYDARRAFGFLADLRKARRRRDLRSAALRTTFNAGLCIQVKSCRKAGDRT